MLLIFESPPCLCLPSDRARAAKRRQNERTPEMKTLSALISKGITPLGPSLHPAGRYRQYAICFREMGYCQQSTTRELAGQSDFLAPARPRHSTGTRPQPFRAAALALPVMRLDMQSRIGAQSPMPRVTSESYPAPAVPGQWPMPFGRSGLRPSLVRGESPATPPWHHSPRQLKDLL